MHLSLSSPPQRSKEWTRFFARFFHLKDVPAPRLRHLDEPDQFELVVPAGITVPRVASACSRQFRCIFTLDDLYFDGLRQAREADNNYIVTVRNSREAGDPVLPHFQPGSMPFITLL